MIRVRSAAWLLAALMLAACGGVPQTSETPSVSNGPSDRLPGFPDAPATPPVTPPQTVDQVQQFVGGVFTDAQAQWTKVFAAAGVGYRPARMVLFTSAVRSGCGPQTSAVGPFYCPADDTVYLDVTFFDEMSKRFGVSGDFAMAYVVAHEVGHHIQNVTGVNAAVAKAERAQPSAANTLSVMTELQADCYAGVWAHSTYRRGLLEPGDIEEALKTAAAIGDDFQQKAATGSVRPEEWTHGSSAQRQQWLTAGYQSGQPGSCDTFAKGV
ncbi:neutral zinc metallopeptidase [Kutzneria buriramensis]|uniref:KPN_02809 family neutral zinc metallopeptidase n=1 Tax=Kutzneria buriramensis TaxID=1045776 RepID=UPI001B882039|nr:neutral zinc metallopeptidase [Kutzneria buriramensis]